MGDVNLIADAPADGSTPQTPPEGGGTPPAAPNTDWRATIDPELAKEASLATFKDINDVVKSYVHAQKMIGKNKLVLPDADYATEEEWREVYKKLGLPEEDKYEVDFGEAQYDDEFKAQFKKQAHEAGILPKQAQKLWDFMHGQIEEAGKKSVELQAQQYNEKIENLKKEWGQGYNAELAIAQAAFKQFADEDTIQYFKESGLAGDTQMIKFLNKIGKSLNEDTFDRNTVKHLGMTKEDAARKKDEVMAGKAYWDKAHPQHAQAVADVQKCFEILHTPEEE